MIKEDYVGYKTAKLLKERGFDEYCYGYYYTSKYMTHGDIKQRNSELFPDSYSAPTLQMAMKWLREVHSIDISIDIRFWTDDEGVDVKSWRYTVYRTDEIEDFGQSDTYEEAAEAGIRYCLERLD